MSPYHRVATFALDEILPLIGKIDIASIRDFSVRLLSWRYQVYALKGTTCVTCGLKAEYFAFERERSQTHALPHLNLYALKLSNSKKSMVEVMITIDHIIPKSKGGTNDMTNLQPMCSRCNQKKADTLPDTCNI